MNRNLPLLWGLAALVVLLVVPGTAVAADPGAVGICVVGVDSPCNGPGANGTDPVGADDETATAEGEPIQFHPDELPYASGVAGEETAETGGDVDAETEASGGLLSGLVAWFRGLLAFVFGFF